MGYDIKQVIIVRKDLNMRKGKIASQVAHASMKVLLDLMKKSTQSRWIEKWNGSSMEVKDTIRTLEIPEASYLNQWLNGSFAKIVVSCNSEDELLALQFKAVNEFLLTAAITDEGATEFNGVPTMTCLAIGPNSSERIDKITGHLKLL